LFKKAHFALRPNKAQIFSNADWIFTKLDDRVASLSS